MPGFFPGGATGMTRKTTRRNQRFLEFAVPALAFGATIIGIFAWNAGFTIEFQYFAIGDVLGSCLLAYLAWTRPRKDIVALSTPIYAIIFFIAPIDYSAGVILQLLYGASITVLLVRLKYRFGAVTMPVNDMSLGGEVGQYVGRVEGTFSSVPADPARVAGEVFTRFAQGDYADAARLARDARVLLGGTDRDLLSRALAIACEQALHLEKSADTPENWTEFLPEHAGLLAREEVPGADKHTQCQVTLDNALLLIFAAAYTGSPQNRDLLRSFQGFAGKLIAE